MKNQWPPSSHPSPSLLKREPRSCCQSLLLQPRHTHSNAGSQIVWEDAPKTQDTHRQTDNTFPVLWWKRRIYTGNKVSVELPNLLHEAHKKLSWLLFFCMKHTKPLCFVPLQQDINFQVPQEWLACVHTIHLWPLKQGSKFTQAIKFCTDLQSSILTTPPYPSLHTSGHKKNFAPSKMNWVNQTSLVHSFNSLTPSKHHFNLNIQIWKSNIKNTTWTFSCANQLQRTQITS